jgi:hypothetical protein
MGGLAGSILVTLSGFTSRTALAQYQVAADSLAAAFIRRDHPARGAGALTEQRGIPL